MKKTPPIEKVFEAWTAIADNRVNIGAGEASVLSSDGSKSYKVRFEGDKFSSDDNATFWQGYPGYPVIAVLMLLGRLPYDREQAEKWRGVNWTLLNKSYRNNYAEAVRAVAEERNIDLSGSMEAARNVMEALADMPIEIKRKI